LATLQGDLTYTLQVDKDTAAATNSSSMDGEGSSTQEFHLGRFCARRTHAFHSFTHWQVVLSPINASMTLSLTTLWKYTLFRSLSYEVNLVRERSRRNKRNLAGGESGADIPEDPDNGDDIMEWLDRKGTIQRVSIAL
jgi:hypothetical protein